MPIALLFSSLLLFFLVDQYYKNTFGEVKPTSARRRLYRIMQAIAGVLAIVAFWADVSLGLPVSFVGLLFASMFLLDQPMVSVPLNRFSAFRLAASVCIFLVSIAPVFFGKGWWNAVGVRATELGVTMFIGVLLVLQGLMWHVFFVKSLPVREATGE